MHSVRSLATLYGTSATFALAALRELGVPVVDVDSKVSDPHVGKFESTWGDKIRSARPATQAGAENKFDTVERARRPTTGYRDQHIVRVAHEHVTSRKQAGLRVTVLPENLGTAHAIDAAGTREGDPWRGAPAAGEHEFFSHPGPRAACGAQVRAVMGEEFELERTDACPRCAELVADGKAFRSPPHERRNFFCDDYLRLKIGTGVVVEQCVLRDLHPGRHKTHEGATWEFGAADYEPGPTE